LLEVLAAVAILGIWYVVIAAMAADGLRHQGESRRRLEAGLLADQFLAEVEASTIDGSAPEGGEEEIEEGDYTIRVFITPFVFGNPGAQAAMQKSLQAALRQSAGRESENSEISPPSRDMQTLLATEMPGITHNLRAIHVNVSWDEVMTRRSIARTSYAFDLVSARKAYESPEGEEAANSLGDREDEDAEMDLEALE
jgi:hypothetical protein